MTFLEKINQVSINLLEIRKKLDSVDKSLLVKGSDKKEFEKISGLLDFYMGSVLELVTEGNQEFIKNNPEIFKEFIKETDFFIKTVNESLDI